MFWLAASSKAGIEVDEAKLSIEDGTGESSEECDMLEDWMDFVFRDMLSVMGSSVLSASGRD